MTAEPQTGYPAAPQEWQPAQPQYAHPPYADPHFIHPDPQYAPPQQAEPQYGESKYAQPQYGEPQFAQPQQAEPRYAQPQYGELRFAQPQFAEPQHSEPQYTQPQYSEPQYTQPQFTQPQFAQPQFAGPQLAQPDPVQPQFVQPAPLAAGNAFSGYAGDMPSGLQYTAPPAEPSFPNQPEPGPTGPSYGVSLQEDFAASAAFAAPAPQAAFPDSGPAPAPQAAYPDPGPASAPQAAYPDPGLASAPHELPGYLKPYPPPEGFSGRGPRVAPVVVFTLLFGVFGMISASRRAKRAEAAGDNPGKYWMAFGVTLSIGWVVGAIAGMLALVTAGFFAAAASTAAAGSPSAITAAEVSRSMVAGGTYAGRGGKQAHIKSAVCAATSVDARGAGTYKCAVALADSTKLTLSVRADASGWRILGKTR